VNSNDDYTEFDEVNDLLVEEPEKKPSKTSNYKNSTLFWLYQDKQLLYITRSAQLHKLQDKPWWPDVTRIELTRHDTPGAAEDYKLYGIEEQQSLYNK
jgi:hypothetical protein